MQVPSVEHEVPFQWPKSTVTAQGWCQQCLALFCNHLGLRFPLFSRFPLLDEPFSSNAVCYYLYVSKAVNFSVKHIYSSKWVVRRFEWLWNQFNLSNCHIITKKRKKKQLYPLYTPIYWQGMNRIILPNPYQFCSILIQTKLIISISFLIIKDPASREMSLCFIKSPLPKKYYLFSLTLWLGSTEE